MPPCYDPAVGLAILLLTAAANLLNRFRVGRAITTGCAALVIAFAVVVALLTTNLLILAVLGYYP